MIRSLIVLIASGACCIASAAAGPTLEDQRAAFREVYPAAERGDWKPVAAQEQLLRDYLLWPDLRAAWLRAHIAKVDSAEILEFLERHSGLKPARELRYRYALRLAASSRHDAFLQIYDRYYSELRNARLDCLAVTAKLRGDDDDRTLKQAKDLWLVGHSQVEECDPLFERLRDSGQLNQDLYRQRFELALKEKQYSLARYLARSLDDGAFDVANRWLSARADPVRFLQASGSAESSETYRQQLLFALQQLAYTDAPQALEFWQKLRESHRFEAAQREHISRHLALWSARQQSANAWELLSNLPAAAIDEEVRRWQVRAALVRRAWPDVITAIDAMSGDERQAEEWQYWLAVALQSTDRRIDALELFYRLAENRSYYGFLAADELDTVYSYAHSSILPDEPVLDELGRNTSLLRARELFYVGLESRGRAEWGEALAAFDDDARTQAALLAHRWGWHSQAISTLASVGQYDDLEMRYPLPYRPQFEKYSASAEIPFSWAYGVARSESLFMADIRSHAGAVGVMQLMPETGRRTARELREPYHGLATLTDPVSNIRLGTYYLGKMLQRFDDNRVLATAAYNAGPLRVQAWLPVSSQLDARIWIENIPYNETRAYVRRVLVTDSIFHWRLTGETRRLSAGLVAIDPASDARVAKLGQQRDQCTAAAQGPC